jgi:hypothetical protein
MRIRRSYPILLLVVLIAAAVITAVELRQHAPPEPARLLPGADAYFYINLEWAHRAAGKDAGKEKDKDFAPVSHDPEYERFIAATGFQFERDLEEAAFAVHYPANWPGGGTGGSAPEPRFSEVLVGKFHSERLTSYLRQIAKSVDNYHSIDIFTVPLENRTLRVAVLGADSVAASNHDDPAVLQGIVDRSKRLASPFGGPAMLRKYYRHVQFASLAWVVARVEPSASQPGALGEMFTAPATLVISGSALSPLHLSANKVQLRAEAFTGNPEDARALVDKANVFLALTRAAEDSAGMQGTDEDVKNFFASIQVKQEGDRALLNASMPYGFMRKMLANSATDAGGDKDNRTALPAQAPAKSR